MYSDKNLVCKDCGAEFVFTAGEQEFYAEHGLSNEPLRCHACRRARKQKVRAEREMFEIVCAKCGRVDTIPFEPGHEKPVYCRECYADMKS